MRILRRSTRSRRLLAGRFELVLVEHGKEGERAD
jgi:hypothetical protein